MAYELAVLDNVGDVGGGGAGVVGALKKKIAAAEELGLKRQVDVFRGELAEVQKVGGLPPPLSADEVLIWRAFLPTRYHEWNFRDYDFDRIPGPVLERWRVHKVAKHFDSYEIWTPERRANDPALIGCVGDRYWLLARWGAEDANLLSFADVCAEVKRRATWRPWQTRDDAGMLMPFGVTMGGFLGWNVGLMATGLEAGLALMAAGAVAGAICMTALVRDRQLLRALAACASRAT